jgi:hypothetical protein
MPTFSPNLPSLLALVLLVPLAACRPLSGEVEGTAGGGEPGSAMACGQCREGLGDVVAASAL